MTNGKNYMEVRQCHLPYYLLRFYFVTRVYSPYMETVIADLVTDHRADIIIINSCLWDITRCCSCIFINKIVCLYGKFDRHCLCKYWH